MKNTIIVTLIACALLSACMTLTDASTGTSTQVTTQAARDDVKWACAAATGSFALYDAVAPSLAGKVPPGLARGIAIAEPAVKKLCAEQDKLTNLNGVFAQVMDAAGMILAALDKKP